MSHNVLPKKQKTIKINQIVKTTHKSATEKPKALPKPSKPIKINSVKTKDSKNKYNKQLNLQKSKLRKIIKPIINKKYRKQYNKLNKLIPNPEYVIDTAGGLSAISTEGIHFTIAYNLAITYYHI